MKWDAAERVVSFGVFGLGMLGGLWSCSRYAHAMFVANDNDSPPRLLAITLALATPLPSCVVALWKRIAAGVWLIVLGCYLPIGMLLQRAFMLYVRHSPHEPTAWQTILGLLESIRKVLGDSEYGNKARSLQQIIADTHGLDAAASIVEQALLNQGLRSLTQ